MDQKITGKDTTSKIKGAVLLSRLAYLDKRGGKTEIERILARLPELDQAVLRQVLPVGWYPLGLALDLDLAIAKDVNPSDSDRVFKELGAASARDNLTTHQASFLQAGDPHRFLAAAPQIYRLYYSVGERHYERLGATSAKLTTLNAETVTHADCFTILGWHEEALHMILGSKEVKSSHAVCRATGGDRCEYIFVWKE